MLDHHFCTRLALRNTSCPYTHPSMCAVRSHLCTSSSVSLTSCSSCRIYSHISGALQPNRRSEDSHRGTCYNFAITAPGYSHGTRACGPSSPSHRTRMGEAHTNRRLDTVLTKQANTVRRIQDQAQLRHAILPTKSLHTVPYPSSRSPAMEDDRRMRLSWREGKYRGYTAPSSERIPCILGFEWKGRGRNGQ